MSEQLEVFVDLTNQKIQFSGQSRSNPAVIIDYWPPLGDGQGYTPLELLLISLASCSGSTIVTLLRKMHKTVDGFEVKTKGLRREVHPTSFQTIWLEFRLESNDAAETDLQQAIALSEEKYCPVWAMLKNSVEIMYQYEIIASENTQLLIQP